LALQTNTAAIAQAAKPNLLVMEKNFMGSSLVGNEKKMNESFWH
jgi:hypothetical protein